MLTFVVILDYCGGTRTDRLVETLRAWNPGYTIHVLDNASPRSRSRYVTHHNEVNTYVGGGINDCVQLAKNAGSRYLLFLTNDVKCVTRMDVAHFEQVMENDSRIVQVSGAITPDTAQARAFPWMIDQGYGKDRVVPHADFLVSMLDTEFIASFDGFPSSRGGWGYAWEFAYHAQLQSRLIVVADSCVVWHDGTPQSEGNPDAVRAEKAEEARRVYGAKYGDLPGHRFQRAVTESYLRRSVSLSKEDC